MAITKVMNLDLLKPKLYKEIANHPNPKQIYLEKLIQEGAMGRQIVQEIEQELKSNLETDFEASKKIKKNKLEVFMGSQWKDFVFPSIVQLYTPFATDLPKELLRDITQKVTTIPGDIKVLRKIERLLASRKKMVEDDKIDWGMAETLAYGSLLSEGFNVRVSGQDVERGTFSHRHAVIKSEDGEREIILLNHINEKQGKFEIYNSLLSEYGVLGFDYGYALASPNTLTIWEAQFGDFQQWSSNYYRPIYIGGRRQMENQKRTCNVFAAWIRGARSRTLFCENRALSPTMWTIQYLGCQLHYSC